MRKIAFVLAVVISSPAFAQQQASPEMQAAVSQAVAEKYNEIVLSRARIITLESALVAEKAKNTELQKQLDTEKGRGAALQNNVDHCRSGVVDPGINADTTTPEKK